MKKYILIILVLFGYKIYAQDSTFKHEIGLTFFTLCEDYYSSAGAHLLPGLQYKYHMEKYNLKSSLVYVGYRIEASTGYYAPGYVKQIIFSAGIERQFLPGKFHLIQGADFVVRDHIKDSKKEYESKILFGVAATGGIIYEVNNRMSVFAEMDVEFLLGGILVTPLRMFSVNYNF